jgi:putative SOS response-associated peptidase YedK
MCGRFVGYSTLDQVQFHFKIDVIRPAQIQQNYNVAPQQQVAVVIQEALKRILDVMHWGLIPAWAKKKSIGYRMINARSETAAAKPAFKAAFKYRRCLIVNDGFYEWMGSKGQKEPVFIKPKAKGPFAFAGLWEMWKSKDNRLGPNKTCTILTTNAAESIANIHHRMPVVLKPEAYDVWLDPMQRNPVELNQVLSRNIYQKFESHLVSKAVNSPSNNIPSLIEPK